MNGVDLQNNPQARWFPYARRSGSPRLRLFCVPYAGGGASNFLTWYDQLPDFVDVYPVQLPGREARIRETPLTQMSSVVQGITNAIEPLLNRPFAFFGHSMGAMICWELACELRRRHGINPARLFVSGRRAPQVADTDPPMHKLAPAELLEALLRFNGIPKELCEHTELMELKLPVLRGDFELCETYQYRSEPPLSCPITAFCGVDDPGETREMLERWQERTNKRFTLHMVPGDHFFLHSSEQLLLQMLSAELSEIAGQSTWNSRRA